MFKRTFLLLVFLCCSVPLVLAEEKYPTKPIEVLVGFAPGGTTDTVIRIVNDEVQKQLGSPVMIVNKPGAGGSVAAKQVGQTSPDGYTLLCVTVHHTLFPAIAEKAVYSIHDFEPIAKLAISPMIILTNQNSSWKTLDEVIDYARKNPGKLKVGVTGIGSSANMICEIIKRKAKVETVHIPFNSESETLTSVLGGHVDISGNSLGISSAHIKEGRLKALASTSLRRSSLIPDVPTLVELGYPEASISTYVGMVAPKKVAKERMDKICNAYEQAIKTPRVIASLEKVGFVPDYLAPHEFQKFLVASFEQFTKVANEAKIKIK